MPENLTQEKPLATIWRVPDELWEKIEPILALHDPPKSTGRPRVDQRAALERSFSGCEAAASGTTSQKKSSLTIQARTAPSRDGSRREFWI